MRFPWSYSKRVVAGAIFGLYMANLLYYLNPQIEITAARLIGVTAVYGLLCGLIFGSILWGLRALRIRVFGQERPEEYRPHGFGLVVTAAFFSAIVYWAHLALLRIYLPRGAVRILSKATTVIAVTAALLLILWLFERASSRRGSRIVFTLGVGLILISSVFLYQRREGYRRETRAPVIANVAVGGVRTTVVAAIRDLPHDWIVTLRGEDQLPFLSHASESGFFARVEPFRTTSPKALWASLNTGKLPSRHGVTGRFSYQTSLNRRNEPFLLVPMGVGFKGWGLIPPVERISAHLPSGRSIPFWSAWGRLGLAAHVIGWEGAGNSLEPPAGEATGRPRPPMSSGLEELSPDLRRELEKAISQDRNRIELALEGSGSSLIAVELESAATAIRLLSIDRNRLPDRHTTAGGAIRAVLLELDRGLERLANAQGSILFAVLSPSAPEAPVLPGTLPAIVRAFEESRDPGADDGFLLLLGSGVAFRPNAPGIEIVDIVPTLLFASGLPVARDMDGRIVQEAFSDELLRASPISIIQTYETDRFVVRRPAAEETPSPQDPPQRSSPRS